MFIFTATQRRANPFAPYTDENGTRYSQIPRNLLTEIPDPALPEDYSDDTYYRTEQDDAPYVVYTKKSDEQIAAARWNKIKAKRDDLIDNGGCFHADKWFHSDVKSKQQQAALYQAGISLPVGIMWKTMDGTFIEMTQALAQSLFFAQMTHEQAIFLIAETKRADTSDINEGWPDRYINIGV